MKKFFLYTLLLLSTQLIYGQRVYFKILDEKTEVDKYGVITLYVETGNKSKKDINILKPATDDNQKWRYYTSEIECENRPLWVSAGEVKKQPYSDFDILTIPSKSKIEIIVKGYLNTDNLGCLSENFKVKLIYDVKELIDDINSNSLTDAEKIVIKKLSRIKIVSKSTFINIKS